MVEFIQEVCLGSVIALNLITHAEPREALVTSGRADRMKEKVLIDALFPRRACIQVNDMLSGQVRLYKGIYSGG